MQACLPFGSPDMDTTQAIPAAWYDDPAGSGGQRWWDGAAWSEHVRPAEAPVFPTFQPAQQAQPTQPTQPAQAVQLFQPVESAVPAVPSPVYSPFQSHVSPGTLAWQADQPQSAVVVNNSAGWTSLAFGVIGLGIVLVSSMLGQTVYLLYTPLAIAVAFGIRALAQHGSGKSTLLVPPILGILMGLMAGLLFLSVLITGSFFGIQPSNGISPQSASEQFPNSPELATMYVLAYDVKSGIHDQYPSGSFPDEVTVDANGVIELNGQALGTLAEGQRFAYHLLDSETFTFTIFGTQPAESMVYDSADDLVTVVCYADDEACPDRWMP